MENESARYKVYDATFGVYVLDMASIPNDEDSIALAAIESSIINTFDRNPKETDNPEDFRSDDKPYRVFLWDSETKDWRNSESNDEDE